MGDGDGAPRGVGDDGEGEAGAGVVAGCGGDGDAAAGGDGLEFGLEGGGFVDDRRGLSVAVVVSLRMVKVPLVASTSKEPTVKSPAVMVRMPVAAPTGNTASCATVGAIPRLQLPGVSRLPVVEPV